MSKGQSPSRSQSGRRVRRKSNGKNNIEDVVFIDVDVVVIDVPETSSQPSRGLRERRRNAFPSNAITIEDEEDAPRNSHDDATNKAFYSASSSSYSAEEFNSEECHMLFRKGDFPSTSTANMRQNCNNVSSRNHFGLDLTSGSSLSANDSSDFFDSACSESDNSDCEIMDDSSGHIREQWERAALRKRASARDQFSSEDQTSVTGSSVDPVSTSPETTQQKGDVENFMNSNSLNHQEDVHFETCSTNSSEASGNLYTSVPTANKHTEVPSPEANVDNSVADSDPTPGVCHGVALQNKEKLISENCSHKMPTANEHTEGPLPKANVDNSVADSDPTPGVCDGVVLQNNEELISEKCSHKMQSVCEAQFEFRRCTLRDVEVPFHGPSPCCSRWHAIPDMGSFQAQKEEVPGKPLDPTKLQCDKNMSHDFFNFHEKEGPFGPSSCNSQFLGPQLNAISHCLCSNEEATLREPLLDDHVVSVATGNNLCSTEKDLPQLQCDFNRERHKASDLYIRADEIEWASRQQQLQIQSEEAHRLRKKKRAERFLLDMERRQKQRVEEIRESQRKDEETINLKEELRAEVRKELDILELRYRDMASLLRALGIHVEGGPFPMAHEVNAAYKRALLKFHPDRSARINDIHQQVVAEEKFKLISLKKKLLPAC